jgi:parallel beta-helix repeat protein
VEDNRVDGNDLDASRFEWWDGGIWLDGGGDVLVRNNQFVNNLGPGIQVSDEDLQSPTGYRLENNTSSGNYFGIYIWNFGECPYPDEDVLTRSGNDFTRNSRQDVWCEPMPCPRGCDE